MPRRAQRPRFRSTRLHRVVEGVGATLPGIEGERTLWLDAGWRGAVEVGEEDDFAGA
jgi:hypothetical protein